VSSRRRSHTSDLLPIETELILIVYRYMARLGQALTSSRSSLELEPDQVKRIEDIISPTGSVHTDGVGLVSPAMAQTIIKATAAEAKEGARSSTCWQVSHRRT